MAGQRIMLKWSARTLDMKLTLLNVRKNGDVQIHYAFTSWKKYTYAYSYVQRVYTTPTGAKIIEW